MIKFIKSVTHDFGRWYINKVNHSEWSDQRPKRLNERPVEYAFTFRCLSEITPQTVLDVGTGRSALPSLLKTCRYQVTAIDNISDYWPKGMFNRHFHVVNDDVTRTKLTDKFDAVMCISVLEHIIEYEAALTSMLGLLKPGGHLILTCPFNETKGVANCYEESGSYGKGNPYPCRQYTREDFQRVVSSVGAQIVKQEWWQFFDSEVWSCGEQIQPPNASGPDQPHQHSCLLIQSAN